MRSEATGSREKYLIDPKKDGLLLYGGLTYCHINHPGIISSMVFTNACVDVGEIANHVDFRLAKERRAFISWPEENSPLRFCFFKALAHFNNLEDMWSDSKMDTSAQWRIADGNL